MRLFKRKPKKLEVPKKAITMGYYEAVQRCLEKAARATIEEIIAEAGIKDDDSDI